MRIRDLVKTYRFLNDPEVPQWNVKFVGGFLVAGLVAGVVAAWAFSSDSEAPAVVAASGPGERTEFVPAQEMPAWLAAHERDEVISREPAVRDGVAGFDVVWRPGSP